MKKGVIVVCLLTLKSFHAMEMPQVTIESDEQQWELDRDIVFESTTLKHQLQDTGAAVAYIPSIISSDSFTRLIPYLALMHHVKEGKIEIQEVKKALARLSTQELVDLTTTSDWANVALLNRLAIQEIASRFADEHFRTALLHDPNNPLHFLSAPMVFQINKEVIKTNGILQKLFASQQNNILYQVESIPLDYIDINAATGRILTISPQGTVVLRNLHTGAILQTITNRNPKNYTLCAALNTQGNMLVNGNADGSIGIYDLQDNTWKGYFKEPGQKPIFKLVRFTQDGRHVFSLDSQNRIVLWNLAGQMVKQWQPPQNSQPAPYAWAGDWIALSYGTTISIYHIETQSAQEIFIKDEADLLALNPKTGHLTLGCTNGKLLQYDMHTLLATGQYRASPQDGPVSALAYNPVDNTIAAGYKSGKIIIWNPSEKTAYSIDNQKPVKGLNFNPSGDMLAATAGTTITIWHLQLKQPIQLLKTTTESIHERAQFIDDNQICATDYDTKLIAWKIRDTQRTENLLNLSLAQLACIIQILHSLADEPLVITEPVGAVFLTLPASLKSYLLSQLPLTQRIKLLSLILIQMLPIRSLLQKISRP